LGQAWYKENDISHSAYDLLLDPHSGDAPLYRYEDNDIKIGFRFQFYPYRRGAQVDEKSKCGIGWGLTIEKKKYTADMYISEVMSLTPIESTYGPDGSGPRSAAVAHYLAWDFSSIRSDMKIAAYDTYLARMAFNGWKLGPLPKRLGNRWQNAIYITTDAYASNGDSATGDIESKITVNLSGQQRNNNAYTFHELTDTGAEETLIESPTLSLSRPDPGYILVKQDGRPTTKTFGEVNTPFTISAVVEMVK